MRSEHSTKREDIPISRLVRIIGKSIEHLILLIDIWTKHFDRLEQDDWE